MSEDEGDAPVVTLETRGDSGRFAPPAPRLNPVSFKLRFASQREQGRSDVSAVKPLGLPATVTDKFYRVAEPEDVEEDRAENALLRIRHMFEHGPRDKYPMPVTSSHVYGWHWDQASKMAGSSFADRRLNHHIQDSAWLKARLIVLAADDRLKRK